jgi:hypothetical protein
VEQGVEECLHAFQHECSATENQVISTRMSFWYGQLSV